MDDRTFGVYVTAILVIFFALSVAITAHLCQKAAEESWQRTKSQMLLMEKVDANNIFR